MSAASIGGGHLSLSAADLFKNAIFSTPEMTAENIAKSITTAESLRS